MNGLNLSYLNPKSKDKDIDLNNSITLYKNLKHLPRYLLCSEGFWLWLYLFKFYDIVKSMMPIKSENTILDHWLFNSGIRRGLMFGVLSRCFFRVELTVDNSNDDTYHLTRWVVENPERYRGLTWRSFSSYSHLVRGTIRGEMRAVNDVQHEDMKVYQEIAKYISLYGSVRLLDAVSEEDIEKVVYDKMLEYLKRM